MKQFKFISGLANCHLPGLYSFVVAERKSRTVGMRRIFYAGVDCRIDLWDGADFRVKPHNHRQDITLNLLFGNVSNVLMKSGSYGEGETPFHVWRYRFKSGLIHGDFTVDRMNEELVRVEETPLILGKPLPLHWSIPHTVVAAPLSAWLVEEGALAAPISEWSSHVARINADQNLSTVQLKGAHHWYPGFYFGGPRNPPRGFSELRGELSKLFCELGELSCSEKFDWKDAPRVPDDEDSTALFSKPDVRYPAEPGERHAKRAPYPSSEGSGDGGSLYGKLNGRLLEVIRLLWDHTARFAEMSYLGGLQDGKNILLQLASGEMSQDDFSKSDIQTARDVQNAEYLQDHLGVR